MQKTIAALLVGAGLMFGPQAQAQVWSGHLGVGFGYGGYGGYGGSYRWSDRNGGSIRAVCSGDRAHALESRLRHEEEEDEIDEDTAHRIHAAIDRLEDRQRQECDEGDYRAIMDISYRYNRIGQWIDNEAQGRGWRSGW